jgi:hypothetical protein
MFLLDHLSIELDGSMGLRRARPGAGTLSVEDFESLLDRERCLADRGTREFALLVVHVRGADGTGPARLALHLRNRIRSTDAVGDLTGASLGVLLPDTDAEGARVLARWVDHAATDARLAVEHKIYVYPRVSRTGSPMGRRPDARPAALEPG